MPFGDYQFMLLAITDGGMHVCQQLAHKHHYCSLGPVYTYKCTYLILTYMKPEQLCKSNTQPLAYVATASI